MGRVPVFETSSFFRRISLHKHNSISLPLEACRPQRKPGDLVETFIQVANQSAIFSSLALASRHDSTKIEYLVPFQLRPHYFKVTHKSWMIPRQIRAREPPHCSIRGEQLVITNHAKRSLQGPAPMLQVMQVIMIFRLLSLTISIWKRFYQWKIPHVTLFQLEGSFQALLSTTLR